MTKRNHMIKRAGKALLIPATIGLLFVMLFVLGSRSHKALANNVNTSSASADEPRTSSPTQPLQPWTAVASTGTIDPSFLSVVAIGSTPSTPSDLGFKGGSSALKLLARYNVTNTFDNGANANTPGWDTLELGAIAPTGSSVTADLYRIENCSGKIFSPILNQPNLPLCSVTIAAHTPATCNTCTFIKPIDFGSYLYMIVLRIQRSNPTIQPHAYTLRVY